MCARIKHQASIIIKGHFICPSAQKSKDLENVGKEARCDVVTASESRRASGCVGFRPREVGRTGKIVPRYSRAEDAAHRPAGRLITVYRSEAVKQAQHASTSGHCCNAAAKEEFASTCDVKAHSQSVNTRLAMHGHPVSHPGRGTYHPAGPI